MSTSVAASATRLTERSSFYFYFSLVFVAIAFGGFARTYLIPTATATFDGPALLHVHGILFLGWTVLLAVQTNLAARGRVDRHRALGLVGISLATAMVFTAVAVVVRGMSNAEAIGNGEAARTLAVVPLTPIALFAVLFCCAVANLRRPEIHKRFIMRASIALLPPAIARVLLTILTDGGRPNFAAPVGGVELALNASLAAAFMAYVPLIAALAWRDWRTLGRPHRVYWMGGLAMIVAQLARVPLARTELWHSAMTALLSLRGLGPRTLST
jgi:hypothetical protein